jgi:purine-nucleoside phosphorylase
VILGSGLGSFTEDSTIEFTLQYADFVGMSIVPEAIVARHMDLDTFGISIITNKGSEEHLASITHYEVFKSAKEAEPKLRQLIKELILQY